MPTIKNILIFLAIGTAFALIYIFFIKGAPPSPALVSTSSTSATTTGANTIADTVAGNTASAQDFLNLLLSVKAIKLNDGIFASKGFESLIDTPVDLTPDGNEGRVNPFASIGNDASVQELTTPTITPDVTPAPDLTPTTVPTIKTKTGATTKP